MGDKNKPGFSLLDLEWYGVPTRFEGFQSPYWKSEDGSEGGAWGHHLRVCWKSAAHVLGVLLPPSLLCQNQSQAISQQIPLDHGQVVSLGSPLTHLPGPPWCSLGVAAGLRLSGLRLSEAVVWGSAPALAVTGLTLVPLHLFLLSLSLLFNEMATGLGVGRREGLSSDQGLPRCPGI